MTTALGRDTTGQAQQALAQIEKLREEAQAHTARAVNDLKGSFETVITQIGRSSSRCAGSSTIPRAACARRPSRPRPISTRLRQDMQTRMDPCPSRPRRRPPRSARPSTISSRDRGHDAKPDTGGNASCLASGVTSRNDGGNTSSRSSRTASSKASGRSSRKASGGSSRRASSRSSSKAGGGSSRRASSRSSSKASGGSSRRASSRSSSKASGGSSRRASSRSSSESKRRRKQQPRRRRLWHRRQPLPP